MRWRKEKEKEKKRSSFFFIFFHFFIFRLNRISSDARVSLSFRRELSSLSLSFIMAPRRPRDAAVEDSLRPRRGATAAAALLRRGDDGISINARSRPRPRRPLPRAVAALAPTALPLRAALLRLATEAPRAPPGSRKRMLEALRLKGSEEVEGFRELLSRTLCALPTPAPPKKKI